MLGTEYCNHNIWPHHANPEINPSWRRRSLLCKMPKTVSLWPSTWGERLPILSCLPKWTIVPNLKINALRHTRNYNKLLLQLLRTRSFLHKESPWAACHFGPCNWLHTVCKIDEHSGSAQTKLFLGPSSLAHVKSGLDGNDDKSNQEFLEKELKNSTTGSLERLPYTALHSQCPAFSVVLLASQTFSSQVYSRFICSYHLTIKTSSSLLPDLNYPTHQRPVAVSRMVCMILYHHLLRISKDSMIICPERLLVWAFDCTCVQFAIYG